MGDDKKKLLSIGQFADLTELSIKALRVYQDQGLLKPAHVDPQSGYRYYRHDQVRTARLIRMLREMDMPLGLVRQVLVGQNTPRASEVIERYVHSLELRLVTARQRSQELMLLLNQMEKPVSETLKPSLDVNQIQDTLITVLDRVAPVLAPAQYRLVGTAASVLQGAKIDAHGVDFLMFDRESIDVFHTAMAPFNCTVPPTLLEQDRQYWAAYRVNGVEVAASTVEWPAETDGIECCGAGPHQHWSMVKVGKYELPVVNQELRLVSAICMQRPEQAQAILDQLKTGVPETEVLRRGLTERGISNEMQEQIFVQLAG